MAETNTLTPSWPSFAWVRLLLREPISDEDERMIGDTARSFESETFAPIVRGTNCDKALRIARESWEHA